MAIKEKKAVRRVVSVEFWRDDKVLDNFSPEDKLFMLYLLTNPQSAQIGVYRINKKTMAYELGYSIETINVLLDRFENTYEMIRYDENTHEVAIKNYLRHSILAGGLPVESLLKSEIAEIKNKELLDYVFENVIQDDGLNASVKKVIIEYYESLHESCDESSNESRNDTEYESCDESSTNRGTTRVPSIINNQLSSRSSGARAREDAAAAAENPFSDDGGARPNFDTVEVYATNELKTMAAGNMQELADFKRDLPEALIKHAIDEACAAGVRTWAYVRRILNRYVEDGIKTIGDAKAQEESREARGARSSPKKTAQEESNEFWGKVPIIS